MATDLKFHRNRRSRKAVTPSACIPPKTAGLYVRRDHPHFSKPWTQYPRPTHWCEVSANIPGYLLVTTTTIQPARALIRLNTDGSYFIPPKSGRP